MTIIAVGIICINNAIMVSALLKPSSNTSSANKLTNNAKTIHRILGVQKIAFFASLFNIEISLVGFKIKGYNIV